MFATVLSISLLLTAGVFTSATLLLAARGAHRRNGWRALSALVIAAAVVAAMARYGADLNAGTGAAIAVVIGVAASLRNGLTVEGRVALAAQAMFVLAFLAWGAHYVLTVEVSAATRVLLLLSAP